MSAVVEFVSDVVGGVVEAVGDVVESVVEVVEDVGSAIDDYVIQPILDDPLSAIATVAAATFLGPAAAAYFGTSAAVGVGIAAGAANTAAGLVQGEDFDDAIKGGLAAGVGAGIGAEFFGPGGGDVPVPETDVLGDFLAANNNFSDVDISGIGAPNVEVGAPIPSPEIITSDIPAIQPEIGPPNPAPQVTATEIPAVQPEIGPPNPVSQVTGTELPTSPLTTQSTVDIPAAPPSPLQTVNTAPELPTFTSGLDTSFTPDYSLSSGNAGPGLKVPEFRLDAPTTNYFTGQTDYSLTPPGMSSGPGLQPPNAPNLSSMGGGQGLTVDMPGLPQYMENGVPTTFTGANGQVYGNPTPDVTVSQGGINVTPQPINYAATTPPVPTLLDQITSGNLVDAAKTVGTGAVDWVKGANPWVLGAGALAATALGGTPPPTTTPPPKGSTQDSNFNKSLDLYQYMRDKANYGGDLAKYGQTSGEHQFFQNTKFVPVPIPGQTPATPATPAKMGGLIQMKHYAQGGMAQGMQGRPQMPPQGGRPPMMQGGAMPGRPMMPQNAQGMPQQGGPRGMPPQGMQQGRPQMPQRPRDPKTAYYQYGQVPTQAKAMGGLSQVHSMKIGGGADGRSDDVNAVLSDGEYVMDAESVAMLGNGSSKAGAAKLDQMRSKLRQHKGKNLAGGKISPNAKSPLSYLRGA